VKNRLHVSPRSASAALAQSEDQIQAEHAPACSTRTNRSVKRAIMNQMSVNVKAAHALLLPLSTMCYSVVHAFLKPRHGMVVLTNSGIVAGTCSYTRLAATVPQRASPCQTTRQRVTNQTAALLSQPPPYHAAVLRNVAVAMGIEERRYRE